MLKKNCCLIFKYLTSDCNDIINFHFVETKCIDLLKPVKQKNVGYYHFICIGLGCLFYLFPIISLLEVVLFK
jgi:hypothetical protein